MTGPGPRPQGRTVALLVAGGFAVGVQVRLLLLSGLGGYPPAGSEGMAWSTLLLLVGVVLVAASRLERRTVVSAAIAAAEAAAERLEGLEVVPAGAQAEASEDDGPGTVGSSTSTNLRQAPAGSLDVRLATPFDEAPAVAPGEDVPLRVQVDRAGLEGPVRLRLAVREGGSRRVRHRDVDGARATWSIAFAQEGAVEVAVTADHPNVEAATARVSGTCRPYREAVGVVLDELRRLADRLDLPGGAGSTPRQVCRALDAGPSDELRGRLEATLYGDGEVPREAYLEVVGLAREVRDAVGRDGP